MLSNTRGILPYVVNLVVLGLRALSHHSTLRRWSDDWPASSRVRVECSPSTSCRWNRDLIAIVGLMITRNFNLLSTCA